MINVSRKEIIMNNFATLLRNESNNTKTLTENFAVAYETSGKHLLDFNFKLSQYRNMDTEDIKNDFAKVFFEDPLIATKFIFYVGDVRGGLGERKIFRACFEWLADNKPEVATAVIGLIPEYTRWDNLIKFVTHKTIGDSVLDYICAQFNLDVIGMSNKQPISLLAKWMPSINASSKDTVRLAYYICNKTNTTPKDYRQTLSALRRYLDVVEVKMSAKEWDKIDYEAVPSLANIRYASAFMKNDSERRRAYLSSLQKEKAKINASVSQPHEILRAYTNSRRRIKEYDVALEEIWKALPNVCVENSLVVRDGSASMICTAGDGKTSCLDIATALAIYCSEHNSKEWENKFITFSSRPKFVDLSSCSTLRDKIIRCNAESDCSNTDIQATMDLILRTAIRNNCSQEDMPKNIIIISDMQFDARYNSFNWNKSLFEQIADDYAKHGYKLPRIIFWNVCSRNFNTIPMQNNELGLILCSGFSIMNMNMFMSGEIDPYKVLLEQLNNKRYSVVEQLVDKLLKTEVKPVN